MRWALLLGLAAVAVLSGAANAGSCGGNADNPMVWNEGFGVSKCRAVQKRYHADDYGRGERRHADSSDPMVWPDNQWSGTLFNGYSRNSNSGYDRRTRRAAGGGAGPVRIIVEREVEVLTAPAPVTAAKPAVHRGPKLIHVGHKSSASGAHVSRFDGHRCKGVLVLSWSTLGSKAHCYAGPGRMRRMFAE